jgi:hypothetical protein
MVKIYGITYGSNRYENRCNIIAQKAINSGLFTNFKSFHKKDLDKNFVNKFENILNCYKGGGYWIWKPFLINEMLSKIDDNDILVYFDSGCEINLNSESIKRFNEYIEMVNKSESGLLRFELNLYEKDFTNMKTFEYFKAKYNICDELYYNRYQLVGGILIMRKSKFVIDFFETVLKILNDDVNLFTDAYTFTAKPEHRHDQSIMSLLYKHMNGDLIIKDETYFDAGFNCQEAQRFPFWATRKS